MHLRGVGVRLVILFSVTQTLAAGQIQYTRDQTRPLSPSVLGTFLIRQPGEIELLVLWRGSPRWFLAPAKTRGSATAETYSASLEYGSVQLDLWYHRVRRVARIRDIEVSLSPGKNVLLVDGVDRNDGPSITAIATDLTFTERPGRGAAPAGPEDAEIGSILGRSAEIASFLRCDATANEEKVPANLSGFVCRDLTAN